MIEINGRDVIITRSSETIIGFLWIENDNPTKLLFKEEGISLKTNLPNGKYIVKEYDAEWNFYDIQGGEFTIED